MISVSFPETGVDNRQNGVSQGAGRRIDAGTSAASARAGVSAEQQQHHWQQRKANLKINTRSAAGGTLLRTPGGSVLTAVSLDGHAFEQTDRGALESTALDFFATLPHTPPETTGSSTLGAPYNSSVVSASPSRSIGGVPESRIFTNTARLIVSPASVTSATSTGDLTEPLPQNRYNVAVVKAQVISILKDEVPKVGAWMPLCACTANPKMRRLSSVQLADQTMALFNLASHALLSTGSSCREKSQAYAESLAQSRPQDSPFPLSTLPQPAPLVEQDQSPIGMSPPAGVSLKIPIHHVLHHLSLPPHSHPLSLTVLGFCYEFGLTDDTVDVPVHLLTGLSVPPRVTQRAAAAVNVVRTSTPTSSTPRATSPPPKSPLPAVTRRAPTPSFWKAELCYVGALCLFPQAAEVREKWPLSPLSSGVTSTTGRRTPDRTAVQPRNPVATTPKAASRLQQADDVARHPDHLALSRLAFLRKYGRPGVQINRREADSLVALVNGAYKQLGAESVTPNTVKLTLVESVPSAGANGHDISRSCCVACAADDSDSITVDRDQQEAANSRWGMTAEADEPERNCRECRSLFSKDSASVDSPAAGFRQFERRETSMISHSFLTDGLTWLAVAAMHYSHPASQYALGGCYHEGVGVAKDEARAFYWYNLSALGGHPRGMGILGYCYIEGFGASKNYATALKWYQLAAQQNDSVAIYNIGYCYEDGIGVEKNPQCAVNWYRLSAEQGNAFAQNSLGYCYEDGIGVDMDEAEAIKWYSFSADQGYPWAECNLGYCYQNGIGVEKDEAVGALWYFKAAKQGHARAQHNLGFCFQNGIGLAQDEAKAVYWYTASAAHDNIFAFHSLGYCYQNGIGVPADDELAVAWYKKAADEGHAPAQLSLGYCYRNGTGVPVSEHLAVTYFELSAEQGNALAQNSLGYCYEEGLGVEKDPQLAVHWYLKSAKHGNPWAQCNIGYCYSHGFGVERSLEKAAEWYEKAARQGHARAQDKLGACYQYGNGVEQNPEQAVYWYRRAVEGHGHVGAMFHLARCLEEGIGCDVDLEEAVRIYEEAGRTGCRDSQKRMTRILSTWCLTGLSFRFGYCAPCA